MPESQIQALRERVSVTALGFCLYAPISILAFPVTVLISNPQESIFKITAIGAILTLSLFPLYLGFVGFDHLLRNQALPVKIINFVGSSIILGAVRGFALFEIVESLSLVEAGSLSNRVIGSIATTFIWLSSANFLVSYSQEFRIRYQKTLGQYIHRKLSNKSVLQPSDQSQDDIEDLQESLAETVTHLLQDSPEDLLSLSESLKATINDDLRPLSHRIWLRSLSEYPILKYSKMLKDSLKNLDFSKNIFFYLITFLAMINNLLIRSFLESSIRTSTFTLTMYFLFFLFQRFKLQFDYKLLISAGIFPVLFSEFLTQTLGFSGNWFAAILIMPVAPAILMVMSLFRLTTRDHELILTLLDKSEYPPFSSDIGLSQVGERDLASYLHNSLQSEILAIASQLEEAAEAADRNESLRLLQKVSSIVNRSFLDEYAKFSESPLQRLEVVQKSWKGILDLEVSVSKDLLLDPRRNAILVQTVEEFAANSFRHGRATKVVVTGKSCDLGLQLVLESNAAHKITGESGLGSKWLDQVSLSEWRIESDHSFTRLFIVI